MEQKHNNNSIIILTMYQNDILLRIQTLFPTMNMMQGMSQHSSDSTHKIKTATMIKIHNVPVPYTYAFVTLVYTLLDSLFNASNVMTESVEVLLGYKKL